MARSRDFIRGLWTHETHCHVIFSTLWTPLWDENIPDGCALLIYHKCNQHSTGFRSSPFRDHSGPNSGMALFRWNKRSLEWQFWQDSLPKIIPPDSTGMTGFRQESQGHDKDLHQHNQSPEYVTLGLLGKLFFSFFFSFINNTF